MYNCLYTDICSIQYISLFSMFVLAGDRSIMVKKTENNEHMNIIVEGISVSMLE